MKIKHILKFFCILLCGCVLFLSLWCVKTSPLQINDAIEKFLIDNGVKKSKIISLCKQSDNIAELYMCETVNITNEQLNEYVDNLLLSHEKMIEITDRNTVQIGDVVIVSYVIRYDSKTVANVSKDPLKVGSGFYGEEFENAIIGAVVGEPFVCELSSMLDTEKYKKGDMLQYTIIVESINCFEDYGPQDQYILDYYGVKSAEEFMSLCEERLKQIRRYENEEVASNQFLDKIATKCKFSMDKQEVARYSERIVEDYNHMAYIGGVDLDTYVKETLNMTNEQFYDFCYNEGVKEIKRYLIVGACKREVRFDTDSFFEFCTMSGYDRNDGANLYSKYAYLKKLTVMFYRSNVKLSLPAVASSIDLTDKSVCTFNIYDSSDIYSIDYSKQGLDITENLKSEIEKEIQNIVFRPTRYISTNHLYNIVLVFENEEKIFAKIMIDEANGFIKLQTESGQIVCAKLNENLQNLIKCIKKTGDGSLS